MSNAYFTKQAILPIAISLLFGLYTPSDKASSVTFKIKNFGTTVSGRFTHLKGEINFSEDDFHNTIDLTVDTRTIDTGISLRNSHLKNEKYFDIDKYPIIHFQSSRFKKEVNGWQVIGQLTIKNVTKEVSFSFTAQKSDPDTYLFKGTFSIDRLDFGVGESSLSLSDKVTIDFNIVAELTKTENQGR